MSGLPRPRDRNRKGKTNNAEGVRAVIAKMDGDYKTATQVSEETGIPVRTLRRWYSDGTNGMKAPSTEVQVGEIFIYLYTPEDVQEVIDYRNRNK